MSASWATPLLFTVLCCAALSGCGEDQSAWYADIHDLRTVPLSDDLGPVLADGIAALELPDPDTESVRMYTWYRSMRAKIYPLETRTEAADEINHRV